MFDLILAICDPFSMSTCNLFFYQYYDQPKPPKKQRKHANLYVPTLDSINLITSHNINNNFYRNGQVILKLLHLCCSIQFHTAGFKTMKREMSSELLIYSAAIPLWIHDSCITILMFNGLKCITSNNTEFLQLTWR